ncbi:MAG: hypothetical protein ACI9NC_004375, partial [Verrucomicrobiales bacterium]
MKDLKPRMDTNKHEWIRIRSLRKFVSIRVHSWFFLLLPISVSAAPLDDQIAAFKKAPTQSEGAVSQILQTGITEHRSAMAFAAVKSWLTTNPSGSQTLLFNAAQAAEYGGEWNDAVSFYRKMLKAQRIDGKLAATAVPATYRLLINHLGDTEAAYLFMREDGDRLRAFGRAQQFDRWFMDEAMRRSDLPAMSSRLATLSADGTIDPASLAAEFEWVCASLESFRMEDETWYPAALKLASTARVPTEYKARIEWASTVVPYNNKLDELRNAKAETINPKLTDEPLAAAARLLQVAPDKGAFLVARGWDVKYDNNVGQRFKVDLERKLAQLLAVVPRMSADQRDELLAFRLAEGQVKFDPAALRKLVIQFPGMLNSLTAADVPLFDKTLTVEEAKALAPQLARNPHSQAAMVRAFAKPERRYSAVTDAMMKSEMWRFADVEALTHGLWHSGMFERDVDHDAPIKKFAKLDARYQQIKKQIDPKANTKDRLAAFKALQGDLLSASPRIAGALPLWDELITNAPDPDKVTMLKSMTSNLQGDRDYLLRRTLEKCT